MSSRVVTGPDVRRIIVLEVDGKPIGQGSKTAVPGRDGGRPRVIEGRTGKQRRAFVAWRKAVAGAATEAMIGDPIAGACTVDVVFALPRPKGHYGSGRNAHRLKPSAPAHPIARNKDDVDKLARAVLDSLAGIVFVDDGVVVGLRARKTYSETAGFATIAVEELAS